MTSSISTAPVLLAVPNISEGRDQAAIARVGAAFARPLRSGGPASDVRLLNVHSDRDHHRSVFTLAGRAPQLGDALLRGAAASIAEIDVVARAHGDPSRAIHREPERTRTSARST
jgi:glutamate formiminotransferase / 5-formyltetrahydrofolate cyclo-ligase